MAIETPATPSASAAQDRSALVLRLIALFKLTSAALLLLVGIGALRLLNRDIAAQASVWIAQLHIDPRRAWIHGVIVRLTGIDRRTLETISAGTFLYAALLLTEGIGLWLRKRWAEYFTVVVTGSFLPLELYEIVARPSLTKLVILLVNAAIVVYLIVQLLRPRHEPA
jgi:uncharacterized membrane protein (DUF2068 family)